MNTYKVTFFDDYDDFLFSCEIQADYAYHAVTEALHKLNELHSVEILNNYRGVSVKRIRKDN